MRRRASPVRIVESDPARPPEDLIDLNPYQTVPTLVDRDLVVYEAGIICEYLDERFPCAPAGRRRTRAAAPRRASRCTASSRTGTRWCPGSSQASVASSSGSVACCSRASLASEPLFRVRPWFLSDQFSLLDAAVAPILWRLRHWQVELPGSAQAVDRYSKRVFAHPAFRASLSEAELEMHA